MTTTELKEILLAEHARDKKLTYVGVFIILGLIIIAFALVYLYAWEYVINATTNYTNDAAAQVNNDPYSSYYKFVIPIAAISVMIYPVMKFLKLRKRHERIEQFITKVESGLIAMSITQDTIYKFTIPLIKVNLKLKSMQKLRFWKKEINVEGLKLCFEAIKTNDDHHKKKMNIF